MQHINKEKIVPYSAANMYSLVADIEKYPDFLPYCNNSYILSASENNVEASIEVKYFVIRQVLTTHNTMTKDSKVVMKLARGPISKLEGCWSFVDVNDKSSKVSFVLDFDIGNKLGMLSEGILEKAVEQIMLAFVTRAEKLYG